ncbi:hypothetical protein CANCADRAFT_32124 [Tortispora caseinolytica NRRL Y-17796]|uniref:Uncharacterized protein n=1 Tax=Tortispora caseinolytica NRRL Y-17796 TaxID=767744 RepID=A0A1E4TA28_9ASCO|nr:hypothetical protein CANCADRAFT_32124 [Tortispora caseinolytica NRRL Y-17796]
MQVSHWLPCFSQDTVKQHDLSVDPRNGKISSFRCPIIPQNLPSVIPSDCTTKMSQDLENQPLLATRSGRSIGSQSRPPHKIVTIQRQRHHGRTWCRMAAFSAIGLTVVAIFNAMFWPRSSLSRDISWFRGNKLPSAEIERLILESPEPDRIREHSKYYTSDPHLAGRNFQQVEYTKAKLEEYGFNVKIETYPVYINYPLEHRLALLEEGSDDAIAFEATLEEDILEEDPTTGIANRVPTFHGYSASGNVTAEIVYANYGTHEDYLNLVAKGVSVEGKIVLVRYGKIFRGLKVKGAQDLGAIGVIMYSDLADDGEVTVENGYAAYPDGPARNPSAVQRGSVQYMSLCPGDPTTPGYASKPDSPRTDPYECVPRIPSLPVSWKEAQPFLKALEGNGLGAPDMGDDWSGASKYNYSTGPSVAKVNLYNLQNTTISPIWNVIAELPGHTKSSEIIIGNHHDAWIAGGAGDPNSGSAALLELARTFYVLKQQGWKPLRSIVLASWDGEEYGLLGSTEWAEDYADTLKKRVIAYLNVDVAVAGHSLEASGSPLLERLFRATLGKLHTPEGDSLIENWKKSSQKAILYPPGSGSDFTVFQCHLGVPTLDFGFGPNKTDAVYHYHSNYDSFHWMDNYVSDSWEYHSLVVKILGLMTVQLADDPVMDLRVSEYARSVRYYIENIKKMVPKEWLNEKTSSIAANFHKIEKTIGEFKGKAGKFDGLMESYSRRLNHDYPWYRSWHKILLYFHIAQANQKVKYIERSFTREEGLDNGRGWFKHIIFAPGYWTGYSGIPFPGLVEAIDANDIETTEKWQEIVLEKLEKIIDCLD